MNPSTRRRVYLNGVERLAQVKVDIRATGMDCGQFFTKEQGQNPNGNECAAGFDAWSWFFIPSYMQIW